MELGSPLGRGKDTCFENKLEPGPGGCRRPSPVLVEANREVWDVFLECISGDAVVYASAYGFEGAARGVRPEAAREIAVSHGLAWTEEERVRFRIIRNAWKAEIDRELSRMKAEADAARANR